MAIIEKQRFIEIMDGFSSSREAARKIDALIEEDVNMRNVRDFFSATSLHIGIEPLVMELFAVMFEDTDDIIDYWAYENDYGRRWEDGNLTVYGENIDLSDAGKLYDYLVSQMRSGKGE